MWCVCILPVKEKIVSVSSVIRNGKRMNLDRCRKTYLIFHNHSGQLTGRDGQLDICQDPVRDLPHFVLVGGKLALS